MKIHTICGIWDAEYRCAKHADGSVTVRAPFVNWSKDRTNGTLDFELVNLTGDNAAAALMFFEAGECALRANNSGGWLTLNDVLRGDRAPGVMPYAPCEEDQSCES